MNSVFGTFSGIPNKSTSQLLEPVQIYESPGFLDFPVMTDKEWESMTVEEQAVRLAYECKIVTACELLMLRASK